MLSKILFVLLLTQLAVPQPVKQVPTQSQLLGSSAVIGCVSGILAGIGLYFHPDEQVRSITKTGAVVSGVLGGLVGYNFLRAQKQRHLATGTLDSYIVYDGSAAHVYDAFGSTEPVVFTDIVGLNAIVQRMKEVVLFIKSPERFATVGATMPRGILLEGPPGTGKTMLAKALAHEANCTFLYTSASSFVELHVGVGAKRIRDIFNQARAHRPAIIFIDELDAIGAISRDAGTNEEYRQTLNELLCQLDGFESLEGIMVLAATNYAKGLDKALKRSGRFDQIISVPMPDASVRYNLFAHYIGTLPSADTSPLFLDHMSKLSEGLTAADIKNLVNEAALTAVREAATCITEQHLESALAVIKAARR